MLEGERLIFFHTCEGGFGKEKIKLPAQFSWPPPSLPVLNSCSLSLSSIERDKHRKLPTMLYGVHLLTRIPDVDVAQCYVHKGMDKHARFVLCEMFQMWVNPVFRNQSSRIHLSVYWYVDAYSASIVFQNNQWCWIQFLESIYGRNIWHTLREESTQTNVVLQYKLLAAILSAVCNVIQQSYYILDVYYILYDVKYDCKITTH